MPWDTQRVVVLAASLAIIAFFFYLKWRRASNYVDSRNELYTEHYRKLQEYALRVQKDDRWPGFLSKMQESHQVAESDEVIDDETHTVHYGCIWDSTGRQYEPDQDETGMSSITAYLKRKSKPRYLSMTMGPSGELTEEKVSNGSWYEMFERSV